MGSLSECCHSEPATGVYKSTFREAQDLSPATNYVPVEPSGSRDPRSRRSPFATEDDDAALEDDLQTTKESTAQPIQALAWPTGAMTSL